MPSDAATDARAVTARAGGGGAKAVRDADSGPRVPAAGGATAAANASVSLRFPPTLTPRQRAVLHAVAGEASVAHRSEGDGVGRRIVLGAGERAIEVDVADLAGEDLADEGSSSGGVVAASTVSDEALCALLLEHLRVDPETTRRHFATPPPTSSRERTSTEARRRERTSAPDAASRAPLSADSPSAPPSCEDANVTLESYVEKTLKLLEMERRAESEHSEAILRGMRPETAQRRGRALLGLRCVDARGGLLGKTVLQLELSKRPTPAPPPLPPHKLTPHDVVAIRPSKGPSGGDADGAGGEPPCSGVVYRVRDEAIEVAVDETPDDALLSQPLRLERLANETTHRRLAQAVERIGDHGRRNENPDATDFPGARLVDVLFGNVPPRFQTGALGVVSSANKEPFPGLDASQAAAVAHALASADVALIHGPPGTGKTTAVVEYVAREVGRGSRVLCCAASNVAVDNLVERLAKRGAEDRESSTKGDKGRAADRKAMRREKRKARGEKKQHVDDEGGTDDVGTGAASDSASDSVRARGVVAPRVVRLGHPARLLPSVLENSLEALVLRSDDSALARDCAKESAALRRRLGKLAEKGDKSRLSKEEKDERREARRELGRLAKEERVRQKKAVAEVIKSSNAVCCTLSGALSGSLRGETFDVVVIDEAAQALEAACWGAILRGRRAVLAGDHLQLPPTVTSDEAARAGLGTTLFQRAHAKWNDHGVAKMLTTQYRMHEDIMRWASDEMYEGKLEAADFVAKRALPRDPENASGNPENVDAYPALMLVDTAGCDGMEERCEEEGESKENPGEARVAMAVARRLARSGRVRAEDIGVIAPYAAQVGALRDLRASEAFAADLGAMEISTVDGFQGREKEVIVISATRSNASGDVGFLSDARRMNVAVTRARRHCALVCDAETIGRQCPFLKRLVQHFERRGEYVSAAEFEGE